jgi:hypothetical protein
LTGNNVKIDKFAFDYFKSINKISGMKKTEQIFDILANCSYYSRNNILDKEIFTLYFTDEQLLVIEAKQKELGYENNLSRFVRYALFDFYMKEHNIALPNQFFGKLISLGKFKLLCDKCEDEMSRDKYTSYDPDLLKNNEKYEGKISLDEFDEGIEDYPFNIDFIEYDMYVFIVTNFMHDIPYSKLVGLSTEQEASDHCTTMKSGEELKPFTDYDNIVPDTDSLYYLFIYCFIEKMQEDIGEDEEDYIDIDTLFNETEEHIDLLLKKYSFNKIVKHFKEKYNIINTYDIFDKECIETLLSDNVITSDDIVEIEDVIESDDIIESNTTVELDENIDIQ